MLSKLVSTSLLTVKQVSSMFLARTSKIIDKISQTNQTKRLAFTGSLLEKASQRIISIKNWLLEDWLMNQDLLIVISGDVDQWPFNVFMILSVSSDPIISQILNAFWGVLFYWVRIFATGFI